MAGASLLALLDDIATLLDDVAVMTKVAAKKTAGVLGDDLALNAQQVSGIRAERELPVVWAVAKGSFRNKLILVPAALLISAFVPWLVMPLLMLGGLYLCLEGAEKLAEKWLHGKGDKEEEAEHARELAAFQDEHVDLAAFEADKIRGAIRTDFVLSAEIIVIALGTVAGEPFIEQLTVLSVVAVLMTIGVYGFVGAIVKLDDLGLLMMRQGGEAAQGIGKMLVTLAPKLMRLLTVVGTAAMFLVGGGILEHGLPPLHHAVEEIAGLGGPWSGVVTMALDGLLGVLAGAVALGLVHLFAKLRR